LLKIKDGLMPGLKTYYYTWIGEEPPENLASLKPVKESVSPHINYVWWDSPAPGVPSEFYAIAWIGYLEVDKPGLYRFYLTTDDGSRLWIDNVLVIDAWRDQAPTTYISQPIYLTKGFHKLKYYYYNKFGFGEAVLGWIPPDSGPSVIPREKFFHCVGDRVFFTNIPDGYTVEVSSVSDISRKCVARGSICAIEYPLEEYPIEAFIKMYDDAGRVVYTSEKSTTIWGGDEFKLVVLEERAVE